jgi:molecular chaperone GrpE
MADQERPTGEPAAGPPAAGIPVHPSPSSPHGEPIRVVDRRWWAHGDGQDPDAEPRPPRKPSYVEQLEQQITERDQRLQDYVRRYKEATAEFDDVRARLRRDLGREIERGRRTLLVEFLDVLDNLDRALQSGARAEGSAGLLAGVQMVRDQFLAKLEGFGVRRIAALGVAFDPSRHEAVTTVPASTPEDDGRVVGVIADGYTIGDEVLRPAMVAVAAAAAPPVA